MSLRTRLDGYTDYLADLVVRWLRSRAGFLQVILVTVMWIPLVVFGWDKHGFLYLYIATALSLITQVPLAMIGSRAAEKAEAAEARTIEALGAILATMTTVHAMVELMRVELDQHEEILEEIHDEVHPEAKD